MEHGPKCQACRGPRWPEYDARQLETAERQVVAIKRQLDEARKELKKSASNAFQSEVEY